MKESDQQRTIKQIERILSEKTKDLSEALKKIEGVARVRFIEETHFGWIIAEFPEGYVLRGAPTSKVTNVFVAMNKFTGRLLSGNSLQELKTLISDTETKEKNRKSIDR